MKFYELAVGELFIFRPENLEFAVLYRRISDRRVMSFNGKFNITLSHEDKRHMDVIKVMI